MRLILLSVFALLLSSQAYGQVCRNNVRVSNYSYPSYSTYTPTYAPVTTQSYYPVQKIIAQEVIVEPLIVTVPVVPLAVPISQYGAQHYYSVQQTYQDRASLRALLREELQNLMAQPQQQQQQPYTPPMQPLKKDPVQNLEKSSTSNWRYGGPVTPEPLASEMVKIFNKSCVTCHGPDNQNPSGGLRLMENGTNGVALPSFSLAMKWQIYGMASTGVMPPSAAKDPAKAVELEALNTMLKWVVLK